MATRRSRRPVGAGRGRPRTPSRRPSARTSSVRRGPNGCGPSSASSPRPGRASRARASSRSQSSSRRSRRPAAGARAPCPRRRCSSGRDGGSGPPARPTRRPATRTRSRRGRSCARSRRSARRRSVRPASIAARASAGIWPRATCARTTASSTSEHLLEPRGFRPDRGHLGQRVAPDHGRPDGCRLDKVGADVVAALHARRHEIASAAVSAASRAASRSGPRPTTVEHASAGRCVSAPCGRRDSCRRGTRAHPSSAQRRGRRSRRPGAARPGSPPPRARCPTAASRDHRQPPVGGRAPSRRTASSWRAAASRSGPSAVASRGRSHLRLGIAEPRVALEEHRTGRAVSIRPA